MDGTKIVAFQSPAESPAGETRALAPGKAPDMRSDLVEQAQKVIPDIPILINLVSKRVRQLNTGRVPLVRAGHRAGLGDIALMEIIEGKIAPDMPEDDADA